MELNPETNEPELILGTNDPHIYCALYYGLPVWDMDFISPERTNSKFSAKEIDMVILSAERSNTMRLCEELLDHDTPFIVVGISDESPNKSLLSETEHFCRARHIPYLSVSLEEDSESLMMALSALGIMVDRCASNDVAMSDRGIFTPGGDPYPVLELQAA
ncbi:MAG: hypothetical protein K0S20_58 [Patescibacteria group bacterium]|jgi:hypothetical protein|nr:hypothetical protein [Patescibacteria group bacterium]